MSSPYVKAWIEKILIPTYETGKPEKNPMFLEKRVYQGSSGVVYPHPVIESVSNEKTDKEYEAVFIENDHLKIMILPELGGRIQRAYDKVKQRDFIYYNQVIKPALVGLAGPWISGGIEFNWPQHHRPSTFSPVDFTIESFDDGSKTVWVSETELMFRTKGMAGFTLYPGKAYLEIKGRLFNGTAFPQTFLWWANPAVKVNDHYQSVFPPDVYAVFDHGKRDVSDFPIATGTYYKVNYAPGTDISKYKNIPVPTSYMAIRSQYDFMGCYEHDTKAGMLHVADHHVSPGKKQWTWGNGDFGYAWDKQLTDEDGPYIELMTGMFTDNQPDFSWMQPNEIKTFTQYFMPYAQIGMVKNATKEAAINIEWENNALHIKVYATSLYKNATITVLRDGKIVKQYVANISPYDIFDETFDATTKGNEEHWKVMVLDEKGAELVSYQPLSNEEKEIPAAATAARLPSEIEQMEDLFLNGLHLEQYRHATFSAMDYYDEGIRRSPGDVRCNNAKGLLLLRRGQFTKAEPYFRNAIATLTKRNPNPYDGEPYYNLGVCLVFQQKLSEAYDNFFKATWNDAWQHSSFLWLARIASSKNKINDALQFADKSLIKNYHSNTTRHLKAALLRKKGLLHECKTLCDESIAIDAFNFGCIYEKYLAGRILNHAEESSLIDLFHLMRYAENNFLELTLQYAHAGMYEDSTVLLSAYINHLSEVKDADKKITPLAYYYLGWLHETSGNNEKALVFYHQAAEENAAIVFPNKIEEILILQSAIAMNPLDAKANYILGNLWYDKRQYNEAIECWERSIKFNKDFATPYRNLAIAYYNKQNDEQKALQYLEKAFELNKTDARVLMELDQLYKTINRSPKQRLQFLGQYIDLVTSRDDLYLERITLLNQTGMYEDALELILARQFHPWEGGEGKTVKQFLISTIELAKQAIENNDPRKAIEFLNRTDRYPENLSEGKLFNTPENDIDYLKGVAYELLGEDDKAAEYFNKATQGNDEPAQAIFYNDPQPDKIFYQGLAWIKLNEHNKANEIFSRFIEFANEHMHDAISIDYFAVSLPDLLVFETDLNKRNKIHCLYMMALGHAGLGNQHSNKARSLFEEILVLDQNHQGAMIHAKMLGSTHARILVGAGN
jgi:tetratricopeptide (TPR) repeat protein